jgi:hypothetical protein
VVVIFDQLRGDYLTRWQSLFAAGGFRRLTQDGAWFQNCHYPYSLTVTAAGHASIHTGCSPDKHGIFANEWFDRKLKESFDAVASERHTRVPPPPGRIDPLNPPLSASPERLLSPTIADALKDATAGKGKVVSLSFKDRSAVLPAGQKADACYWLDIKTGEFVTSTYYGGDMHSWVRDFNKEKPADQWIGKPWTRLRPELDYVKHAGPDDMEGESTGVLQGRTFPHPMGEIPLLNYRLPYYGAVYNSPFGNELLLALAKRAIVAEELGKDETPDLLCLSFSSNDAVGHSWGPDSQEVLDMTLRSDRLVEELLGYLDEKVGKGNYVIALSSDHGVCPLPEISRAQGKPAQRLSAATLRAHAEEFLDDTFAKKEASGDWIEGTAAAWLYLSRSTMQKHEAKRGEVEAALTLWLAKQTGIEAAFGRGDLLRKPAPANSTLDAVRRSFHADRAGDVYIVLKPYHIFYGATGTSHGTPHAYDTHVPLVVFGPGVKPGPRKELITPQATARIVAEALGIPAPKHADAATPAGLFAR